jgi:predicted enzyme related to lactoylglutathione lyase
MQDQAFAKDADKTKRQGERRMFAQINHVAICSPNWPMMARFYEAVFGLQASEKRKSRPVSGANIGDGHVGLNINPVRDGYVGGLDHFGMTVDDVEAVMGRARKKFPDSTIVKRPSTRPFAAYSAHDPDGNVFDLAEKKKSTLDGVYADQADQTGEARLHDRYINKFAIRTLHPEKCADFYMEVFELEPLNRRTEAPGYHLTDGRVMLSLMPWSIPVFEGMSIKRPGPDHFGFKVENLDTFKKHIQEVVGGCTYLAPMPLGGGKEADVRKAMFAKSATGKYQMADPGGVWIDVTDE